MEQANAVEPERVEQRHDVGKQLVACVAPPRPRACAAPGAPLEGDRLPRAQVCAGEEI
jgi:hypothetical protein